MNKTRRNNILLLALAALALVPSLAFAQSTSGSTAQTVPVPSGFSGIFSCNQNGSNAMSVGALGATGGVYVPVADATVELNTGTLVYKECILREVVDAQSHAADAGFVQQGTNQVLTGRNGSPEYAVLISQELTTIAINSVKQNLPTVAAALDTNIQTPVENAIAQGVAAAMYNPQSSLTCQYQGATSAFANTSNTNIQIWNVIPAIASPCNPLIGYDDANDLILGAAAAEQNCQLEQWQWGGGFYSVTNGSGSPCENQIQTPSSQVNSTYAQLVQSPFNQLQNANDIGQMVGALFGGISSQVLAGNGGGISGLTQPIGNQPSYLQQAVNQETQNLQSTVANAALVNLDAALQVEQQYYNTMSQIAGNLEGAITQLRGAETTCFQQMAQTLCPSGISNGTCTDTNGVPLKIATSTEFSQPVVNSQIAALASTTLNNLQVSQQALNLINQLIQNVSGSSADAQAVAIQQLNTLIANNELHTQADIQTAESQQQAVQSAMTTLVQNTPQLWAGTDPNNTSNTNIPWNGTVGATITASSPGVGWCNFQNQTSLQAWENIWRT